MENTVLDREEQQAQEIKHVGFGEQMAFNFSAMFRDMSYALLNQFHTFWVNVLGYEDTRQMAWLQLTKQVWDGITDPAVGAYFDRQSYVNEKARRYFRLTALPLTILLVMIFMPIRFTANANLNTWIHMGFILLCYLPFDPLHSLNGTAFMSYYNSITPNIQERSGVIARSRLFSTLGSALVGGIPMISGWFTSGIDDAQGHRRVFLIATIVVGVAFLAYNFIMYSKVKERTISPSQGQRQSVFAIFRTLLNNRMFLVLVASNTIRGIINRGATDQWLFAYNIGDISWSGYVGLIGGLPAILAVTWIWPKLCERFEKRNIVLSCAAARLIIRGLYLFIGMQPGMLNLTALNTSIHAKVFMSSMAFIHEIPNNIQGQMYWSLIADSVDYGEWKTGKRNDGMIYTMEGLMNKIIGSVGALSTGYILRFIGFVPQAAYQSAHTMRGLFTVPLTIELISIACSNIPFFFWNLTRKQHAQMIDDIKARATPAEEPAETS
ncbi:MAG: MFS transporter [Oscillospiraceae bacterium]|nr:MFS transporter [Oscillospiraceae bacterium]